MATVSKTFSVRNGIDVANTIVLDSNRNLSNVVGANVSTANATTINATNILTSAGLDVPGQANAAYGQANTARGTANDAYAQANTARDTANDSYAQANTARTTANDSYAQANTARDTANDAYGQANTARTQANNARDQANTARTTANDSYGQANSAYAQANAAITDSQSRVLRAGDTMTGNLLVNAFIESNSTFVSKKTTLQAPSTSNFNGERLRLYDFAETGHPNYAIGVEPNYIWTGVDDNAGTTGFKWYGNTSLAAVLQSNGTLQLSNTVEAKVFKANGTGTAIDASQGNILTNQVTGTKFRFLAGANTINVDASGATANYTFTLPANSGLVGQVLVTDGNGLTTFSSDIYTLANISYGQANTARDTANDAYGQANAAYGQANTARGTANDAYAQANSARDQANTGYGQANAAYGQANAAYGQANAAYGEANLKLNLTGGTISGDVTVQGNLYLTGNATYINVATLKVNDSIIQLSTNSTSDAVDIGFIGHYSEDGGTTNLHAGFIRHASDNVFYIFDGYGTEPVNNVIDVATANLAWLRANVNAASLLLQGNTVATQANLTLAHDQANTARGTANDAYGQANAARDQANTARDTANGAYAQANGAYGQANGAYAQANGAYSQANGAFGQANGAYAQANGAYTQANVSANTVRVYANSAGELSNKFLNFINTASIQVSVTDNSDGNANISFVTTGAAVADAYAQANAGYAQANAAYSQANAAYADANTRVLKSGDTMTGGLTITTTGEGLKVANANVTNYLSVGTLNVTTNTVTTSTTGQVVLDTFALTAHASAKYFVQANSGTDYTVTEMIVLHDGTNVYLTEYGTIQSGPSLGIFSADIDSGSARLLFTANNNVNTIRSVRYGVLVP